MRALSLRVAATALALVVTASAGRASAQNAATAIAHVDISGIWFASFVPRLTTDAPMTPAALAIFKARTPQDDPMAQCLPPGVPRLGNTAFPIEIVQKPKQVTILYEYDHYVRRVYTDGRGHDDPDPSWLGHSIGRWEGRTLVVDTVALKGESWLDEAGHPSSDQLHVAERYTLSADGNSLLHEITIDDPKMYTKPWSSAKTYRRRTDMKMMEFVCET